MNSFDKTKRLEDLVDDHEIVNYMADGVIRSTITDKAKRNTTCGAFSIPNANC